MGVDVIHLNRVNPSVPESFGHCAVDPNSVGMRRDRMVSFASASVSQHLRVYLRSPAECVTEFLHNDKTGTLAEEEAGTCLVEGPHQLRGIAIESRHYSTLE